MKLPVTNGPHRSLREWFLNWMREHGLKGIRPTAAYLGVTRHAVEAARRGSHLEWDTVESLAHATRTNVHELWQLNQLAAPASRRDNGPTLYLAMERIYRRGMQMPSRAKMRLPYTPQPDQREHTFRCFILSADPGNAWGHAGDYVVVDRDSPYAAGDIVAVSLGGPVVTRAVAGNADDGWRLKGKDGTELVQTDDMDVIGTVVWNGFATPRRSTFF